MLLALDARSPAARNHAQPLDPALASHLVPTRKKASGRSTTSMRSPEIEAEIARNELGAISEGRVLSFEPVESTDPVEAWDRWFEQSAGDWSEARVEALLGGRRD